MPWLSIFAWIVSFFLSKKKTKDTASAALIATGVAAGTYYLADPSNPDNLFKIGVDTTKTASSDAPQVVTPSTTTSNTGVGNTLGSLIGSTVDATGKVLTSWGPTGTAAVIGTAGAVASDSWDKWWPWIAAAGVLILLK